MNDSARNQNIALSAVCLAAQLVQNAARGQAIDEDALTCLLNGVMNRTPDSAEDVYTPVTSLKVGSDIMVHQLSGQASSKDVEVTRYLAGMLSLAKKLMSHETALAKLMDKLSEIERRLEYFDITDPSILANFGDTYSEAISPIGQKIKILGTPAVLSQKTTQSQVRACLLAGIRAAVLWRQSGGRRRQFIFKRNAMLQNAKQFNNEL
jgi:high frequency lysogenization protein